MLALCIVSVNSCIRDGLTDGRENVVGKEIATLEEQSHSIKATIADVKALRETVEGHDDLLDGAVRSLENHLSYLNSAPLWADGTLASLAEQKTLASALGAVYADAEPYGATKTCLKALDAGAGSWLGKNFGTYWSASLAKAKINVRVERLCSEMRKQQMLVEGLVSDVEAGLRKDEDAKGLVAVAKSVEANLAAAQELSAVIGETAADLEHTYTQAVHTMSETPDSYDADAVMAQNKAAATALAASEVTLESLAERVTTCENAIKDLQDRLGVLEDDIKDLKELLDMVQSVVYMSDNATDDVYAYYTLGPATRDDGKMVRTPAETITLNYLVRPASAAAALETQTLWNDGLKIVGYYAGSITKAVSMQDFTIQNVTASEDGSGLVTLTVTNTLSEDFYFKETGAKMALSLVSGKTDLTSKFSEVVPKDDSGKIYVESLGLSTDYVEVDCDLTHQLRTSLTPENPTDATLLWTSSDENIATVSETGVVSAKVVGEADITVTTRSTDEWGRTLSKVCRVKVMPNIKLEAANSVEVGGTMTITVKSPNYIDKQYIKWTSSNTYYATVDENGVVTGNVTTYNASEQVYDNITITCTIGDYNPTVLKHVMPVIYPQPKGVRIASLDDGVEQKTIKIAEQFSLAGSIIPDAAASYYRMFYQVAGAGNESVASINYSTGAVDAKSPGSVTFMARVLELDDCKYYYPVGTEVWRWVTVNVEPYWVKTISLPATLEMAPKTTATLTPEFTSDIDDVPPSYKTVTWTSSDPSIVSVDEKTGEMTAIAEGTVYITATTCDTWAVPEGTAQKSATCVVTVKAPTVAINVGDFYYSDGTWSTERNYNKTVIGVIFSTVNAVASDPILMRDYPNCSHGLVVGLTEYESMFGIFRNAGAYSNSIYDATAGYGIVGYGAVLSETLPTGYGLTLAYGNYRENIKNSDGYADAVILFDETSGVAATQNKNLPISEGVGSAWYIPSKAEMNALYSNKSKVNTAIAAAGGTSISDNRYWSCYLYDALTSGKYHDCFAYPIDMSDGSWINNASNQTSYKVRTIFAF